MIYWFIHIFILGALSYAVFKRVNDQFSSLIFWTALGLKLSAGIILGLIFYYYYGFGDTISFFKQATALSNLSIAEHLSELIADGTYAVTNHPRDLFFVKIISVFTRLTSESYWITSLYLSFLSFVASSYFVVTISGLFPKAKTVAVISFLFIPSVIFWSSGILKDTLSSTVLIFLVAVILKGICSKRGSVIEIVIGIFSLMILFYLKHYLFITFILFTGLFIGFYLLRVLQSKIKWVITIGVMILALGSTQYVHPYLKWERIPQTIVEINNTISDNSSQKDQSLFRIEDPRWNSIISAGPAALYTGLLKPSIFDQTGSLGWIHKIENLVLTILMILSLLLWMKDRQKIDLVLLIPAVVAICLLATMLALTTPNFGTLVRYKNAFMPFLFLIASMLPFQYLTNDKVSHSETL